MTNKTQSVLSRLPAAKKALLTLVLLCLVTHGLQAQVASPSSGFFTLQIRGHHNISPSSLSFIGIGLTCRPVSRGRIDSFGPSYISDSHAKWTDGQFEGANGPHYLEITSGPYAGFTTDIIKTDATTKSLYLQLDVSGLLTGGESYKVRPHWTLARVFGANDESGLGSGSLVTADQILILNAASGVYTTYYYKTVGLGGTGWRSTASPFVDQSNAPIRLGQGLLVRRLQPNDLSLKLFGDTKVGPTLLPVSPGINISANILPADVSLALSGLYTGNGSTGLNGGSITSADKLLLFDGTSYQSYYYKTIGLGGTGWRSTGNAFNDASATVIPAGTAVLIQRLSANAAFYWTVPPPL